MATYIIVCPQCGHKSGNLLKCAACGMLLHDIAPELGEPEETPAQKTADKAAALAYEQEIQKITADVRSLLGQTDTILHLQLTGPLWTAPDFWLLTEERLLVCKWHAVDEKAEIKASYAWQDLYKFEISEGNESATIFIETAAGRLAMYREIPRDSAHGIEAVAQERIAALGQHTTANQEPDSLFLEHHSPHRIKECLEEIWDPDGPRVDWKKRVRGTSPAKDTHGSVSAPAEPSWLVTVSAPAEPEWVMGMTHQFVKDILGIDRKVQGRILEAVTKIIENPGVAQGDTIKPLTGDKKGMWRIRLGDFRLLYRLDNQERKVTLTAFASRGDAYEP